MIGGKVRFVVCVLLAACFVLPGLGSLARVAGGDEVEGVGMAGYGVWVDEESAEPFVLMVWVEDGDVYFSSTFEDQYSVVLEDVLVTVVEGYEMSAGGVRARYAQAIGHIETAPASEDSATCVDTLSKTVVLLSTLGEDEVVQDIADLVREQAWLGLLYNMNKTQNTDGDVGKALHHYNQALSHMEAGRQVAAMQSFAAAFKQMPHPILGWDKITRLSYTGECRTPLVYWAYDEAYDTHMLHAGWIATVEGNNHTIYARSTNQGRTWWALDATQYGTPYLYTNNIDPYEGNPLAAMTAVRLLEKIYVIDGSHYFYVPFPTPPILPPTNPPFTGELGDTIYGSIDDPTFDKYTEYTWITIGGRHFIKPICRPGKIPLPPPKMADLIVVDFVTLPGTVLEGKPAIVEVEVKNIGTGGISGTISISLGNNGNFVVENFTTSLSEGEVKTFSFSEFYVYERPLLSVEVFANTQEGDTENNRLEKDVFITYEHDLAVVSVKPSATLCVSQQGVLDVMVENRGHEKISSVLFYVFSHTFDMLVPFDFVLPLLPGSSRVLQVDIPSFEESGLFDIHVMGFIVDASPEIYSAHDNLGSTTVPVYEVVSSPWIVTGEEEYYGKAFLVKNGLTVENGGNLSLLDCTITFSSTISKLFVKQGGEMSLYVSQVSSTPGTISGFVVEGSIVMEYSAVSNIMGGVDIRSPLNRINYSEIYECSPQAIIVSDNPVFVTNSVIRDSPIGVKMANSLGSMFERCTIYNNDIGVDAFASQTYLDKCNVQNTMNIRADDKIAAQTTISLVDTPVPWTSVLLSGSSQIVAHRNMFVQIHESDGSLSLVDHTLTINGGPVKDSDDGNLDGVYANLLVTQWRRNRHGSSNNIEMDINGIPLDKHISAGYVTQPDVAIIIGADDFSVLKTIDWDENTFYVAPAGSSTVQFVFSHEYLQHGNTYLQTLYETSFDEAQEMQIRYVDFQDNQLFSGCQEAFEDKFLMYDSPFSVPTPIKNIEICFELSVPRAISQIWGLSEFASPFENNMMAKFFMALYSHVPGFLHIPTNAEVQYQFHHYNPEGQIEKYDYVLYNENQFLSNLCLKGRKQGFPILRYEKTISHFPDTEILNGGQYAYTPNEEHLQTTGGDTKAALRMEYTTYSDDSWVKIEYVGGKLDFGPYTIILKGTHILNVPPARNAPKLPLPFFSMDNLCWAAAQTMILNYWRNPGTSLQSGVTVEPSPFKDMPPLTTEITAVLQSYNHRFAFLKEYPGWFGYNSGNTAANQRHMFMYAESNAQSIGHEQFIKEFRNSINATPIGPAIGHPVYLWRYDGEFAGYGHALTGIGYSEVTVLKNGMPHSFQSYFYCENPGYYVGPSLIPGTDIGKIELEKPGFCAEPTTNHRWIYNVLYWGNNYPWV